MKGKKPCFGRETLEISDKICEASGKLIYGLLSQGINLEKIFEMIALGCYRTLFAAVVKYEQTSGSMNGNLSVDEIWKDPKLHQLVIERILWVMTQGLDEVDPRHQWSVAIVKREKPYP